MQLLVKPKIRGFVCTTAHPEGCEARVKEQIDYVQQQQPKLYNDNIKNVLVIGASTGYGLASRIVSSFGLGAKTLGVFFEREAKGKRTASPGWYNSASFEKEAQKLGLYTRSLCGDAFSIDLKKRVIDIVKQELDGEVNLVIYSLAAPYRIDPEGKLYKSVLKPIDNHFYDKTVNILNGEVSKIKLLPATKEEIISTEKVMGGEDWELWINALLQAKVLASNAMTIAYSYIGPQITYPIYHKGTIGIAKEHLEKTAIKLDIMLNKSIKGKALISINKALVTQASFAIPVVPLYLSLLYKVMKDKQLQEGCIEQIYRLFSEHICNKNLSLDNKNRIRMDKFELQKDIQNKVTELWNMVDTKNINNISDIEGCRKEFYQLFGFKVNGVNYDIELDTNISIPSLV